MAKAGPLQIDTTEALEKLQAVRAEFEKIKADMARIERASSDATKAMREFVEACRSMGIDDERRES